MRKIKWENIATLGMIALGVVSMIHHIKLNGLFSGLLLEPIVYGLLTIIVKVIVKDIRKNPDNWKI